VTKKPKLHNGVDFRAGHDTAIYASETGTAIYGYDPYNPKTKQGGGGYYTKIVHSDGYETLYMHQNKDAWLKGKKDFDNKLVPKGEKIGGVGSSGKSTGNHLHFEIRKNGKPVDAVSELKNGMN
jgi:murein DD-endopeptidase MepM/ murein hydrolase activator NlpD